MGNENISLANKYRPRIFEDVLGQEPIVSALKGKLKSGKLPRTSMYCGAHGSGKTTLARIVAKAVNCENPIDGNPCCKCDSCREIDSGLCHDVIEMDAASHNKVEDAENIIKQVEFIPRKKKKVVILDEMHMLTKEAQNKLLKVVEEPPEQVIFIFCTTEEEKVLPTILSRCNKFTFKAISTADILHNLRLICEKEQIEYEDDALKLIAKTAEGHVRDSISVLEQLSGEKVSAKRAQQALGVSNDEDIFFLLQAVLNEDYKQVDASLDEIMLKGNLQKFLKRVVEILCYLWSFDESLSDSETDEFRLSCKEMRRFLSADMCLKWIDIITKTLRDNRGLGLDLAVRFCFLSMLDARNEQSRIDQLEAKIDTLQKILTSDPPRVTACEDATDNLPDSHLQVDELTFDDQIDLQPIDLDDENEEDFVFCVPDKEKPGDSIPPEEEPEMVYTDEHSPYPISYTQDPMPASEKELFADMPGIIIRKDENSKENAEQKSLDVSKVPEEYQECANALKENEDKPVGQLKAFRSFMSVFEDFM